MPLYVSTLIHLNKVSSNLKFYLYEVKNILAKKIPYFKELFEIAHSLVKQYPQDAVKLILN